MVRFGPVQFGRSYLFLFLITSKHAKKKPTSSLHFICWCKHRSNERTDVGKQDEDGQVFVMEIVRVNDQWSVWSVWST